MVKIISVAKKNREHKIYNKLPPKITKLSAKSVSSGFLYNKFLSGKFINERLSSV